MPPGLRHEKFRKFTIFITAIYAVLASLWIYFSDRFLDWWLSDSQMLSLAQTYKGALFILITATLLYALLLKLAQSFRQIHQLTADTLAHTTREYEALERHAPVGVFHTNADGQYQRVNGKWSEITGLNPEQAAGSGWLWSVYKPDRDYVRAYWRSAIAKHLPYRLEYRVVRSASDEPTWVLSESAPIRNDHEQIIGFIGTITDITQIKQISRQLAENEDRLRLALKASHQGIFDMDFANNRLFVNDDYARMLGYEPKKFSESYQSLLHRIHDDDRPRVNDAVGACIDNRSDQFAIEARIRRHDGDWLWVLAMGEVIDRDQRGKPLRVVGTHTNIDQRKRQELELQLAAKVYANSGEGIMITDAQKNIIMVNQRFIDITGYSESEVIGQNPKILSSGRHKPEFYRTFWGTVEKEGFWQGEIWNRRKNGEVYPEWLTVSAIRNHHGKTTHYVGQFADISQSKQAQERIHYLAHYDMLTDLPNRHLLHERVEQMIAHAERHQEPLALLYLDIDRFKHINESLGHSVGDRLLRAVASRCDDLLRKEDVLCRIGGDEFVIALPYTAASGAAYMAESLQEQLAQPFDIKGQSLSIKTSIGISLHPENGYDFESLLQRADTALYRCKRQNKSPFVFFTEEMQTGIARTLELENRLSQALRNNELFLTYQPQVNLATGELTGLEALLRWNNPDLGMISPMEFIPIAEETGLILSIGEWVLQRAAQQAKAFAEAGLRDIGIAVNISAVQCREGSLANQVANAIEQAGIEPGMLELELTETTAMEQAQEVLQAINAVKALGVKLSVDDFGTGYSSLTYLRRYRADKLKIDRSFVKDLPQDSEDAAICEAVIQLGRAFNLTVIAEGVENQQQADFLRQLGCHQGQGYLWSKPQTAEELLQFLPQCQGQALRPAASH